MGVYFCTGCHHVEETANGTFGEEIPCRTCNRVNRVADTVVFVTWLLKKYSADHRALKAARARLVETESEKAPDPTTSTESWLDGIDLRNTSLLTTDDQHRPIADWFAAKKGTVTFNYRAIDTTEFYDDAALEIGRNYALYRPLLEEIRTAQGRGVTQVTIPLVQLSQADAQTIVAFCYKLYEYALLANCVLKTSERSLRLTLLTEAPIVDFFGGAWLEWFVLLDVLEMCKEKRIAFSCARNLSVVLADESDLDIDLFWLVNAEQPVWIECKTGDFMSWISIYTFLRQSLGLTKAQFVLCVAGLKDDEASTLTRTHGITLVNERGLKAHVASLIRAG